MIHQVHPKCPGCKKALYKAMEKGAKVSPEDPYQYCRNSDCALWGYREAEPEPEAPPEEAPEAEPEAIEDAQDATTEPEANEGVEPEPEEAPAPSDAAPEEEPQALQDARARIRILATTIRGDGHTKAAIGLTLALLNQELECHTAANVLIDEFDLGRFGIHKVESTPSDEDVDQDSSIE